MPNQPKIRDNRDINAALREAMTADFVLDVCDGRITSLEAYSRATVLNVTTIDVVLDVPIHPEGPIVIPLGDVMWVRFPKDQPGGPYFT